MHVSSQTNVYSVYIRLFINPASFTSTARERSRFAMLEQPSGNEIDKRHPGVNDLLAMLEFAL